MQFRRVSSLLLKVMILFVLASPYAQARAGGGAAGGAGGLLTLILLPFAIAYALYINHRINKKKKATDRLLNTLSQDDPAWKEADLEAHTRQTFLQIQAAWCKQDLAQLESLLHPQLFPEWKAQIELMQSNGERNVMENLRILQVRLVEAQNYRDKEEDIYTACIEARATDYTIGANGEIVSSNTGSRRKKANKEKSEEGFREFWTYERHDEKWLLLRIDQSEDWKESVDAELVDEK
jgi:predicted lipid-binding transport protein (Tim44 family)